MCTGSRDVTEIMLKTALNTMQSINKFNSFSRQDIINQVPRISTMADIVAHMAFSVL